MEQGWVVDWIIGASVNVKWCSYYWGIELQLLLKHLQPLLKHWGIDLLCLCNALLILYWLECNWSSTSIPPCCSMSISPDVSNVQKRCNCPKNSGKLTQLFITLLPIFWPQFEPFSAEYSWLLLNFASLQNSNFFKTLAWSHEWIMIKLQAFLRGVGTNCSNVKVSYCLYPQVSSNVMMCPFLRVYFWGQICHFYL